MIPTCLGQGSIHKIKCSIIDAAAVPPGTKHSLCTCTYTSTVQIYPVKESRAQLNAQVCAAASAFQGGCAPRKLQLCSTPLCTTLQLHATPWDLPVGGDLGVRM